MARACLDAAHLPAAVHEFVAGRAEGIPFLVEEVLAGLIGEGALTERDGHWHAADLSTPRRCPPRSPTRSGGGWTACARSRAGSSARPRCSAAGSTGRCSARSPAWPVPPWSRRCASGTDLQLVVAERDGFRFRHALTHEAVLAGLLPPERTLLAGQALAAAEAAHPGLPGAWCTLAADLAGRAGDAARAGALLLEAGRRDLAAGALASAEQTLTQARELVGPALRTSVDEALTEVFAMSGQVDRAMETGKMLLARLGPPSPRAAHLHLGIARAAIAGARWAEAAASIEVARESAGADAGPDRRVRGAGRRGPGPPGGGGPAGPGRAAGGRGQPRGSAGSARRGVRGPRGDRPGRPATRPRGRRAGVRPGGGPGRRARAAVVAAAGPARAGHHRPAAGPRAWTGWSRRANWPWPREHWPSPQRSTCRSPPG